MLTAYYDLWTSPPTYDIVAFLCAVERGRLRRGEDKVRINILPGPVGGFRKDKFWPFSIEERQRMLDKVAVPMARMLPSIAEVAVWKHRPERPEPYSTGWMGSLYGLALQVDCMREGVRPLRPSVEPRFYPKLVTITLRQAEHWPERNSNVAEWTKVAEQIEQMGYTVVVIPDAAVKSGYLAATDLEVRARHYRSAACNLFVNNGPAWFAMALDAPVLMLKPTVEGVMHTCSRRYFQECGIPEGGQIPNAPAHQRIVWAEDTAENIVAAFTDFMESRDENHTDGSRLRLSADAASGDPLQGGEAIRARA